MMQGKSLICKIAYILVLIGGVNWGFYGISSRFNIVEMILGTTLLATLTYLLIGASAVYLVAMKFMKKNN